MESDDTSTNKVFHKISQFNYSDTETPDEFADSEPSPPLFPNPPFNLSMPNFPMNLPQRLLSILMQPQLTPQ